VTSADVGLASALMLNIDSSTHFGNQFVLEIAPIPDYFLFARDPSEMASAECPAADS